MIFVIEHKRDNKWQVDTVICEDLDTTQYQPVQKIFLCENMEEAIAVNEQLQAMRVIALS